MTNDPPIMSHEFDWEEGGFDTCDTPGFPLFNVWCSLCGAARASLSADSAEDWAIDHECGEPTAAQMEALTNPDSGPSESHYRYSMRDAGRGHLLR